MSFKTEQSPSSFGIYLLAVLMASFSALLGFAYMASFSPKTFSSLSEYRASLGGEDAPVLPSKPGDVYSIKGAAARVNSWEAKREQLKAPGAQTVRFSAGEINAWLSTQIRPGVLPKGDDAPSLLIVPGVPNVAITTEDELYLNLATQVEFFGNESDLLIFGRCVADGGGLRLVDFHVSGAKIPLPDVLGPQVLKVLLSSFQASEEFAIISQAFDRLDSFRISNGELIVQLR